MLDRKIYKEVYKDVNIKFKLLQGDILRMNELSDNKSKLISLQDKQIEDLKLLGVNSDKNIALLKKDIKDEKRKKVKFTIIGISTTALITATIVSIIK